MTDHEEAIEQFLESVDTAFEEYDQGYADADATVTVVRDRVEDLRERID